MVGAVTPYRVGLDGLGPPHLSARMGGAREAWMGRQRVASGGRRWSGRARRSRPTG